MSKLIMAYLPSLREEGERRESVSVNVMLRVHKGSLHETGPTVEYEGTVR